MSTSKTSRAIGLALLASAIAVPVLIRLPRLHDAFEAGLRGQTEGAYHAVHVRSHLRYGFSATRWHNAHFVVPGDPPAAVHYVHHPPTYILAGAGVVEVFGGFEAPLRVLALVVFAFGAVALYALVARVSTPIVAGVAALLWGSSPAGAYYGVTASVEAAAPCLGLVLLFAAALYARRGGALFAIGLGTAAALAASMDWCGYLYAPSAVLVAAALGGRRALRGASIAVAAGVGVAAVAFAAGTAYALGGFDATLDRVRTAAVTAAGRPAEGTTAEIARHVLELLSGAPSVSIGLLVTALFGVAAAFGAARTRPLASVALAATFPGAAYVALFRAHAAGHDFWWTPAAPGVAVAAAAAAGFVVERGGRVGRIVVALAVVAVATLGVVDVERRTEAARTEAPRHVAAALDVAFGEGDLVATDEDWFTAAPYAKAMIVGVIRTVDDFETVLKRAEAIGLPRARVAYVTRNAFTSPELLDALARFGDKVDGPGGFAIYRGRP